MALVDPLQTLRTNSYSRCMATRILTVEDVFDIKGCGLVVVPGPLVDTYAGPRQIPMRLILPNGDERMASMRLDDVFQTPPRRSTV